MKPFPHRLARPISWLVFLFLAALAVGCGGEDGSVVGWTGEGILVIEGATVVTSPFAPPIPDAQVVVVNGFVEALGERGTLSIPGNVRRVSGIGGVLMAGLHDLDVRIPPEILEAAADFATPAQVLEDWLAENFLRFGFTFVLETGTPLADLEPFLQRIQGEGIRAPAILGTGGVPLGGLFPGGGAILGLTAEDWGGLIADDVTVISSLSLLLPDPAVDGELGSPPFVAAEGRWAAGGRALRDFVEDGGRVAFGSGFGWGALVDPLTEVESLMAGGLGMDQVLAALTTEPAFRLGRGDRGEVEPGMVADLILLDGDPFANPSALERVRWVLRGGMPVFGVVR